MSTPDPLKCPKIFCLDKRLEGYRPGLVISKACHYLKRGLEIKPLLPIIAFVLSVLNAIFLFGLVFLFSDPAGSEVGAVTYSIVAVILGLLGALVSIMAKIALKKGGPYRRFSIAAIWVGVASTVGAVLFLIFGVWFLDWASAMIFQ